VDSLEGCCDPGNNSQLLEPRRSPEPVKSYFLTDTYYFCLVREFDWSRWVAISSLPPICSPNFSFMGAIRKN
jgi:hypothetical protein